MLSKIRTRAIRSHSNNMSQYQIEISLTLLLFFSHIDRIFSHSYAIRTHLYSLFAHVARARVLPFSSNNKDFELTLPASATSERFSAACSGW